MMKNRSILSPFIAVIFCFCGFVSQAFAVEYFDVQSKSQITSAEFYKSLSSVDWTIMGEVHNQNAVQYMESLIISQVTRQKQLIDKVTVAWEFFDNPDQGKIDVLLNEFYNDHINAVDVLDQVFSSANNHTYLPVMSTAKEIGAQVIATNLTRAQKSPVVKGGIQALDPALLPPNFSLGDQGYYERFLQAMGAHSPSAAIDNYFAAQCLTDEVIAYSIQQKAKYQDGFLIIGSFHSDYFSGVVQSFIKHNPSSTFKTVRFILKKELGQNLLSDIMEHPTYGAIADFIVLI